MIIIRRPRLRFEIKLGNLNPTRDFLYVKDTCNGFLEVLKSDRLLGQAINIGLNSEISMKNLAKKIITTMNLTSKIKEDSKRIRPIKSEVDRLCCDNKKILSNTSWKPNYNLDKGLEETIEWYKKFYTNKKNIIDFSYNHLKNFTQILKEKIKKKYVTNIDI